MGKYNKYPTKKVDGRCICGYSQIIKSLTAKINKDKYIMTFDCYPGVNDTKVLSKIRTIKHSLLIDTKTLLKSKQQLKNQLKYILTNDRVFGKMYFGQLLDFFDDSKIKKAIQRINKSKGTIILYGVGANLIYKSDLLIYLDLSRWEIQGRYRAGMSNYLSNNPDEDILKKFKQGYFLEWRIADKHKNKIFEKIDYFLDTNITNNPKMVLGDSVRSALKMIAHEPFRTVPYFDPGVWGGQWMKKVCNLNQKEKNFAWSFDGVPEENSIYLEFDKTILEIPAIDLIMYKPEEVLGKKTFSRYGAEFPIRFDLLDTMGGQNLSLQVHPTTEYIRKEFGMAYTQDESYYILDAGKNATVYLGLQIDANKKAMINDLEAAEKGEISFNAEKYINRFAAKKHDHFLIPAGTIHCSGANTMVLEISSTPYIFTFKLWDWGRVGFDNKPRPINVKHGLNVIRWDRNTSWVNTNLINKFHTIKNTKNAKEEITGLHELEPIETKRYWINTFARCDTKGTVNMLNLVEGDTAIVSSPTNNFNPFEVHYAETFIIPASVGEYEIRNKNKAKKICVIKAYVRGTCY